MPRSKEQQDILLEDFARREIRLNDITNPVYSAGSGAAVIIMPGEAGITPSVAQFSRWVRDEGFTVYLPALFRSASGMPTANERSTVSEEARSSTQFQPSAASETTAVTQWLRRLANIAHEESGGAGVGAIGGASNRVFRAYDDA